METGEVETMFVLDEPMEERVGELREKVGQFRGILEEMGRRGFDK